MAYTKAVFNVTEKEIETGDTSILLRSASFNCFDPFIRYQRMNHRLLFRPESLWMTGDISVLITINTGIKVRKLADYFYMKYPPEYSDTQKMWLDYIFHQIYRVPTIASLRGVKGEKFQDILDKTIEADPYWTFQAKFDFVEFLREISPKKQITISPGGKQTSVLLSILSPVYAEIGGRFLRDGTEFDLLILAESYNRNLLEKLTSEVPEEFSVSSIKFPQMKVHPLRR